MKKIPSCGLLILLSLTLLGCSKDLYNYRRYEDNMYAFARNGQTEKDERSLLSSYKTLVNKQKRGRKTPPPGTCAEYGKLLYRKGNLKEARKQFEREMQLYPESKTLVLKIMKDLEP